MRVVDLADAMVQAAERIFAALSAQRQLTADKTFPQFCVRDLLTLLLKVTIYYL